MAPGAAFPVAGVGSPERNICFAMRLAPRRGSDFFARVVGAKLAHILGQQVIIDNRSGAQAKPVTVLGAKAAPDGHTTTLGHMSVLAIGAHLDGNPGLDVLRDIAGVERGVETSYALLLTLLARADTFVERGKQAEKQAKSIHV